MKKDASFQSMKDDNESINPSNIATVGRFSKKNLYL